MPQYEKVWHNIPSEWQSKVSSDFVKMKNESPSVIDPEKEKSRRTLTAIVQFDEETREKICEAILPVVNRFEGLFLQPKDGLHFSIQWSEDLNGDVNGLAEKINQVSFSHTEFKIMLAFPSKPNLFAIIIPSDPFWMQKIRSEMAECFQESGFSPKLPSDLPLIWMSLVRFTSEFDSSNLDELVEALPQMTINPNDLTLFLAVADPFFTKQSAEVFLEKKVWN